MKTNYSGLENILSNALNKVAETDTANLKTCYKCKQKRPFEFSKCKCGETKVLNTPNASKLYQTLRQ